MLNLIDRLPRWSQYRTAYADDDDAADAWAREHGDGERPAPSVPLTHWTPEVERLTELVDILAEQTAILVAANFKGGYHAPRRSTRPETAFERALRRAQNDAYEDLLADIEASKRRE